MSGNEARSYPVNVDFVENDGLRYYHAWFPLFDNVDGTGDSVEEAVASAYEILEIELDYRKEKGIDIPVLTPKEIPISASGRITLRMARSLHNNLIQMAEEEGVSLNTLITTILASHCGAKQSKGSDFPDVFLPHVTIVVETQMRESDSQESSSPYQLRQGSRVSA